MSIGELAQQVVLDGSLLLAVPVAVLAGLVSFASPCVLPLVPGYLGYVSGMAGGAVAAGPSTTGARRGSLEVQPTDGARPGSGRGAAVAVLDGDQGATTPGRGRVLLGTALFVAGFTAVFVLFGVLAGSLGALVNQWSDPIMRVLGVVVVVMGLVFLGWVPWARRDMRLRLAPRTGLWGAPLLGLVFGLGWAPCIGPTLVAVYTLALDGASAGRGALLSVAYCIGLGLPFLAVAAGFDRSSGITGWLRRHRLMIMRLGGGILLLVGVALVSGLWSLWTQSLQGLIGGFQTVL